MHNTFRQAALSRCAVPTVVNDMNSTAQQLASVIHRSVQDVLTRGLNDPRVKGLISVTEVKVSSDLVHARIGISILPEQHAATSMKGIQSAKGFIRSHLSKQLTRRRVPQLTFHLDQSIKKQSAIHAAINRAVGSIGDADEPSPPTPDDTPAAQSHTTPDSDSFHERKGQNQ